MYSDDIHCSMFNELINQESFNDIINWIENHSYWFLVNQYKKSHIKKYNWQSLSDFKICISSLSVEYDENVKNTHHCPRNGITNWQLLKHLPTGYSGWYGNIEFEIIPSMKFYHNIYVDRLFNDSGIHLGSGSGLTEKYFNYEVKFFDEDWPGLINYRILSVLSNDNSNWKSYFYDRLSNHYKKN